MGNDLRVLCLVSNCQLQEVQYSICIFMEQWLPLSQRSTLPPIMNFFSTKVFWPSRVFNVVLSIHPFSDFEKIWATTNTVLYFKNQLFWSIWQAYDVGVRFSSFKSSISVILKRTKYPYNSSTINLRILWSVYSCKIVSVKMCQRYWSKCVCLQCSFK